MAVNDTGSNLGGTGPPLGGPFELATVVDVVGGAVVAVVLVELGGALEVLVTDLSALGLDPHPPRATARVSSDAEPKARRLFLTMLVTLGRKVRVPLHSPAHLPAPSPDDQLYPLEQAVWPPLRLLIWRRGWPRMRV
jgi:hypothetical protein